MNRQARVVDLFTTWLSGSGRHGAFLRTVGGMSAVRLAGGLLLFLSQILLARWMGADAFGAYSYAWAWATVLATLAVLGFPGTSVRFLAAYRVEGAQARMRGLIRFGRSLALTVSVAVAAGGIFVVEAFGERSPYAGALQAAFLGIPAIALLWLEAGYARGFNWMVLSSTAEQIGRPLALIALGWWLIQSDPGAGAREFALACTLAYLLAAIAQHGLGRPRIRAQIGTGVAETETKVWMGVSVGLLALGGAQMARLNVDLVLVGTLLGPLELGVYAAAVRTATLVSFVMTVTSVAVQPGLASLHAQSRQAELVNLVSASTRSIFIVSLIFGAALAVIGPFVLARFGAEFTSGYPALLVLIAGHVLVAASGPLTSLLTMTGHQNTAAVIHGGSVLTGVALNALLIPPLGIMGAAVASSLNLLGMQPALIIAARRFLGTRRAPR
jgi:O-antigen/teichoic acid export membrane protein